MLKNVIKLWNLSSYRVQHSISVQSNANFYEIDKEDSSVRRGVEAGLEGKGGVVILYIDRVPYFH